MARSLGQTGASVSEHTLLGLPDPARTGNPADWLLVHPQYVSAYDTTNKVPRWVSWELDTKWLGSTGRTGSFVEDTLLPANEPQGAASDFSGSGFQRGHMCPSADRTDTTSDNQATFVYTNVVPQSAQSNTGPWEVLENEERTLARAGSKLVIAAGPSFASSKPSTIGSGVAVPTATWKVVVVLPANATSPTAVTDSTRVIAVSIPNDETAHGDYRAYLTSTRAIEQQTGLNFMSDVPQAIQDVIENQVDTQ
jgi:endonuclease G